MLPDTYYTLEPRADGKLLFAVFDRRLFQDNTPVHAQLDRATYFSVFSLQQAFHLGTSFIQMANTVTAIFLSQLRQARMVEAASHVEPMTDADRAALAIYIEGMADVNLDPEKEEKHDDNATS